MRTCPKCGVEVADDAKFCSVCGARMNGEQTAGETKFNMDSVKDFNNTKDTTSEFDPEDIEKNKVISLLSYLGLLFLVPLFVCPQSKFARYHVNQGIVLFIADLIYGLVCGVVSAIVFWIPIIGSLITGVLSLVPLIFMIIGIVNAVNGRAKELPIIGKFTLLK